MGTGIRATIMRGGTSKGIFLERKDLPEFGPKLDALLLNIMGSPDPMQIDGLGGTHSSTSKVIIVEPINSTSVKYWFAQIGITDSIVDWGGNCGNLTTAVGPFSILRGLVETRDPVTTVHLLNMNTGTHIDTNVYTNNGDVVAEGELQVSGVPGTGSPVSSEYLNPSGSVFSGKALPTGNAVDQIEGIFAGLHRTFSVSIVDVTHPYIFVDAADFNLNLDLQTSEETNANEELLDLVDWVRASGSVKLGLARTVEDAMFTVQSLPRIVLLAPSHTETIRALSFSMKTCHHAIPMTAALCIAAATHIPETLAANLAHDLGNRVSVRHPRGVAEVTVDQSGAGEIKKLTVFRTARRLMSGEIYPRET